ncbi:MAG TPA: hypothetical protein VG164_11755 [Trebonia sp.]|nr:hypothetical protein [Trebonia sp.]
MNETVEALERRMGQLRVALREAVLASDQARVTALRAELRQAEGDWEDALVQVHTRTETETETAVPAARLVNTAPGPLLPLREQVYEALSLLQAPAAPRLIATVHEAFFATTFPTQRVTSLRRDEERSFRVAPFARPYYICAALTADFLIPSRGLLAASTWPMEKRVIGPLSPRVDFLEAAIRVAEAIERIPAPVPAARRLLARFAASIPGACDVTNRVDPRAVKAAAGAELSVHKVKDAKTREEAARRARQQLDDAQQLFGTKPERKGTGESRG